MSTDHANTIHPTPAEAKSDSGLPTSIAQLVGKAAALLRRGWTILTSVGAGFAIFAVFAVQGVVLARLLGPTDRGAYATIVFYTQALTYIGLLGTSLSIARRAAKSPDGRPLLARAALRSGLMTGVLTMAVVMGLALVALPADKQHLAPLCLLAALLLPFEHARLSVLAVDHGAANFGRYNVNRLFAASVLPALLIGLWVSGLKSLMVVAILAVVAPAVGLVFQLASRRDRQLLSPSAPPIRKLLSEGRPYALATLATDLFGRLDMLLMLWLTSLTKQGLYAAAIPAASVMMVAPHTLHLFAFNAGANRERRLSWKKLGLSASLVGGFQLISAAAFALVLPFLMLLVFGSEFRDAIPFALLLVAANTVGGCSYIIEGYLQGRDKALIGVWARVLGAVVMLATAAALYGTLAELAIPAAAIAANLASLVCVAVALLVEVHIQHIGGHSTEPVPDTEAAP